MNRQNEFNGPEELSVPSAADILAVIHGELSARRRWVYRAMLLVVSVLLAALLSLWMTEPGPLPIRLHVAFATLAIVQAGWIGVFVWILTRRNCPSAIDRIATSWMAVIGCTLFLAVGLAISIIRGGGNFVFTVAAVGSSILAAAVWLLRCSYANRADLKRKLEQHESAAKTSRPNITTTM